MPNIATTMNNGGVTSPSSPFLLPSDVPEEYEDLVALLFEHGTKRNEETLRLARVVAAGCLGGKHLWEEMKFPNRRALSDFLSRHFRSLYDKNTGNMKWKKFFYKQLCEREGMNLCKSPNCEACMDYNLCFESEEENDGGDPRETLL